MYIVGVGVARLKVWHCEILMVILYSLINCV